MKIKNVIKIQLIGIFSLLLFFFSRSGHVFAYNSPRMYLTDLNIERTDYQVGDKIRGEFKTWNTESYGLVGVNCLASVAIPSENTAPLQLDLKKVATLDFAEESKRTHQFSYTLPEALPTGTFTFKVFLELDNGIPLGWDTENIEVQGGGPFIFLADTAVLKDSESYPPGVGVKYPSNQYPIFKFTAKNQSAEELTVYPKITVHKRTQAGEIFRTLKRPSRTFKGKESKAIEIDGPLLDLPGTYIAKVALYTQEDVSVSNPVIFRWSVKGVSSTILNVTPPEENYDQNEQPEIRVDYAGPADGSDQGEATLRIELYDAKGVAGEKVTTVDLGPEGGSVTLSPQLGRACKDCQVRTEISKAGTSLDSKDVRNLGELLDEDEASRKGGRLLLQVGICVVLLLLVLAALIFVFISSEKRKKIIHRVTRLFSSKAMLFLLAFGFLFSFPKNCFAAGSITWNKPLQDSVYLPGDDIEFQGIVYIDYCVDKLFNWTVEYSIVDDKDDSTKEVFLGRTVVDDSFYDGSHHYEIKVFDSEGTVLKEQETTKHPSQWPGAPGADSATYPTFDPDNNPVFFEFPSGFNQEYVWAKVHMEGEGYSGEVEATAYERLRIPQQSLTGYVWEDANSDGVKDSGEDISGEASVWLDDVTRQELDPEGFSVNVSPGNYRVYIEPEGCFCLTYWNRSSPPSDSGAVFSYQEDLAGVWYADVGEIQEDESKHAYLGIKKAGFALDPVSEDLTVGTTGSTSATFLIEHNGCWENNEEIDLSLKDVPAVSGISASLSHNSLVPTDTGVNFRLDVETDNAPEGTYNFQIRAEDGCGNTESANISLKVEVPLMDAWFQSEAGDIYARKGISNIIPSVDEALPFRNESRFVDLASQYNYLSMSNTSPGVILSGNSMDLGTSGEISEQSWQAEDYLIGFYDPTPVERYTYDYNFFDANLIADCVLTGDAEMGGSEQEGEILTADGSCTPANNQVIKVNGDLDILGGEGFQNARSAILVNGTATFKGTWELLVQRPKPDVMLVMDRSGSMMGEGKISDAKKALKAYVDASDSDHDLIGLATYSASASLDSELTDDFLELKNKIDSFEAQGSTSIGAGLQVAIDELLSDRAREPEKDHPKFIILATDGQHNTDPPVEPEVDRAVDNNIWVITVGIGSSADESLLEDIARETTGSAENYYYAPSSDDLENLYEEIAGTITNVEASGGFQPTGGSFAFIANKDIEISAGVRDVRAILLADGTVYDYDVGENSKDDWENQDNGLWIQGNTIGLGYSTGGGSLTARSFDLRRTRLGPDLYTETTDDDGEAAGYFSFDPQLLFQLTPILGKSRYTWHETK
ncbi:MAG: VWA domain-containing protein [Patescibacteria group bacterium]